jgi:hypothetical protein
MLLAIGELSLVCFIILVLDLNLSLPYLLDLRKGTILFGSNIGECDILSGAFRGGLFGMFHLLEGVTLFA